MFAVRQFSGSHLKTQGSLLRAMSSASELVTCEFVGKNVPQSIAKLTFNAPKSLNALTVPMATIFNEKIDQLLATQDLRAVVLTGAGND